MADNQVERLRKELSSCWKQIDELKAARDQWRDEAYYNRGRANEAARILGLLQARVEGKKK